MRKSLLLLLGVVILIEPHPVLSQEWQLEPSNLISSCDMPSGTLRDRNYQLVRLREEIETARALLHAESMLVMHIQVVVKEGALSQTQLDRAVAGETLARTRLERLQAEFESEYHSRQLSRQQAQAQLRLAEAELQFFIQQIPRVQLLVAEGALPELELMRARARIQTARENLVKAQACLMQRSR